MLDYNERTQMFNIAVAIHNACIQHIKRMPINTLEQISSKGVLLDVALETNSAITVNRMNSIWRY